MAHNRRRFLVAGGAGLAGTALGLARPATAATAAAWETVINDSFTSYASLEATWNYRYPWGSDHNGTARMYASSTDHNHVYLDGNALTLKATRINWDEGNSSADPYLPIRYHSGAVHAKQHVVVSDEFPQWEVKGEFQAPSGRGTWPAFWLTGVNSWPPESDILEYKGDARNWFNTYKNASGGWSNTIVNVSDPGSWHGYRAWISKAGATDVDIHYYLDDQWVGQHRGADFVGRPMWIIINLQMEGSSGSSGPTTDTHYRARNIYVGRSRA
ncbi:family 16 glycosylhydrolase [Streptomyces sp. MP131-18]|uniref:glycoside hydrolase family 16 protein n=1 Tax=Streptomyces sp. MP131-18 TaxID=1857892 RepID=UPI00097C4D3E|nr:family 16 glycosylhydrolase [Streptomyces sp. MP131-18]ONK12422.1 Endo-1,3-1,4-beta-glycanase ExsH [Streptomyces sp. MP131-18]